MPLSDKGRKLVEDHLDLARMVVAKHYRLFPVISRDEMESLCYLGLCTAADRWEEYCTERGFNPDTVDYFKPYAYRRMQGAINDKLREMDPLTRAQRRKVKAGEKDIGAIAGTNMSGYLLEFDPEIMNSYKDREPGQVSQIAAKDMLTKVVEFYKKQPQETQVIIALYYYKEMLLNDVAALLGTTESHCSKVHSTFIVALRQHLIDYLSY